jgi:Lrp/AsnC family transcriptional regulator, leucine-responsive regulatory protein
MPSQRNIDEIDRQILTLLQDNARMTQVEIAKAVGLAPSAIMERIRKLDARRAIRGYVALVDPHVVDQRMLAFVAVRTSERLGDQEVAVRLAAIPEVLEVHHVAGDDCLLLKLRARDAEHVGDILRRQFGVIPGIRSTRTTIVLETTKETPRLPIPLEVDETVIGSREEVS